MKAIALYTTAGSDVGKLWVRPRDNGGGLIEIKLTQLPMDGTLHAVTPVDCKLWSAPIPTFDAQFPNEEKARGWMQGVEFLNDPAIHIERGPHKRGAFWYITYTDTRKRVP